MDEIRRFAENDRFARHVGAELLEVSEGRAKARLRLDERHLNGAGMVHGGVIFSLADLAFEVACNSYGTLALAINVNISFMRAAAPGGTLLAEAEEVSLNPRLGTYDIRITDDHGELVATFQGMAYRKKDKLPV
jgi:acyl-CoA thioesterase